MPVIDTDNGQMDVISRLLKDRILLLGQQVDDEVGKSFRLSCYVSTLHRLLTFVYTGCERAGGTAVVSCQ